MRDHARAARRSRAGADREGSGDLGDLRPPRREPAAGVLGDVRRPRGSATLKSRLPTLKRQLPVQHILSPFPRRKVNLQHGEVDTLKIRFSLQRRLSSTLKSDPATLNCDFPALISASDTLSWHLPSLSRRFLSPRILFPIQRRKSNLQRGVDGTLKSLFAFQCRLFPAWKWQLPMLKSLEPALKGRSTFQRRMDAEPLIRYPGRQLTPAFQHRTGVPPLGMPVP